MTWDPLSQPIVDSSAGWTYPAGYTLSGHGKCRSCGASIAWMVHDRTGRRQPFNPDGTSHFSNCPHSQAWREGKIQKKGAHA